MHFSAIKIKCMPGWQCYKSIQFDVIQFNSIQVFNSNQLKSIRLKSHPFSSIQFNSRASARAKCSIRWNSFQFSLWFPPVADLLRFAIFLRRRISSRSWWLISSGLQFSIQDKSIHYIQFSRVSASESLIQFNTYALVSFVKSMLHKGVLMVWVAFLDWLGSVWMSKS